MGAKVLHKSAVDAKQKNPIWRLKVSKCALSAKVSKPLNLTISISKWCIVEHSADDEPKDIPSSKWQKVAVEVQVISKKDRKLCLIKFPSKLIVILIQQYTFLINKIWNLYWQRCRLGTTTSLTVAPMGDLAIFLLKIWTTYPHKKRCLSHQFENF